MFRKNQLRNQIPDKYQLTSGDQQQQTPTGATDWSDKTRQSACCHWSESVGAMWIGLYSFFWPLDGHNVHCVEKGLSNEPFQDTVERIASVLCEALFYHL